MAVRAITAKQIESSRVGLRSRSLRENVEIEPATARAARAPGRVAASSPSHRAEGAGESVGAVRDRSARADAAQRTSALLGRSDQVRAQLASAWSSLG